MRIPFRERNPVPIGLAGFAVIIVLLVLAMNLGSIPFISGTKTHTAAFAEAAGLKPDEEVRIAGVKVGKVTATEIEDGHVKVTFQVDNGVRLGDRPKAEIKIKTVLGAHYLALTPRGSGNLSKQIPLADTATPFEVVPAVSELTTRLQKIDYQQVAKSFDVLSDTFENSPDEIRASLKGLRRLSSTIASRDEELHQLAGRARNVSQLLADRNQDFAKLIEDGDKILQAVQARRAVIHQLLINTVSLSQQINALIKENQAQLKPMLRNLSGVTQILLKNQQNLDRTIELFAPFTRQFSEVTGNGRWFDAWIQNLLPIPAHIEDPPKQSGGTGAPKKSGGQNGTRGGQNGGQNGNDKGNPLPFLP
ncbi:MCE family protein [Spirillospora sp. NPDC048911]|uniref:MCE family protein n=1 Tax=Spirillospora sp. NPDC048911 TaxID=3364527 RepID=UPI0037106E05